MKGLAIGLAVALVTAGSATAAFVVTSKNIKNGTIQLVDISPKAKRALRGQQGPQGPQGIQAITEVRSPISAIPPGLSGSATASCPAGQQPISGGFQGDISGMTITASRADPALRAWVVSARNSNPTVTGPLFAYAYCSPNVTITP